MCLPWANTQVRPYKPMPYNPEADYTVVITDSGIACERREHPHRPREAIARDEVNEILDLKRLYTSNPSTSCSRHDHRHSRSECQHYNADDGEHDDQR